MQEDITKTHSEANETHSERASQLRLAFIELARIEREIAALDNEPHDARERELLAGLRGCRATLLRIAEVRLRHRTTSGSGS